MRPTRRGFIGGASALSAASLGGLTAALTGFNAHAADVSGYKALVCVFLLGGMDNHDTLIPYDALSYDDWAQARAPLLAGFAAARSRENLLPLDPDNRDDFGGREFALPPEMPGLAGLFASGEAALVANVGPLIEPVTRSGFDAGAARVPLRLFSHNDQQATWQASAPEGAQFGWGGLFADAALSSNANNAPEFTTITSLGNELFLTGQLAQPYQVSLGGAAEIELLQAFEDFPSGPGRDVYQTLRNHFRSASYSSEALINRDIAAALQSAFDSNERFNMARSMAQPLNTAFGPDFLSQQLQAVAETISIRNQLGVGRQIFFVAVGGFDTHSAQAADLPGLQAGIDAGITSFHAAMQELGLSRSVTLFTASDFGRTLAVNGDGTDHGWGAHHFVVGGAVQGRRIYGDPPPAILGHEQDAGGGRLIPTIAVEQYAEPLGRWFGLTQAEVETALPNLRNFGGATLPIV